MLDEVLHRKGAGYGAAIAGVLVVTAVFGPFYATLSQTTVALAYLLVVLFVATGWGRWPAMFSSLLAMLCFNFFFLPPVFTFTIADPQNWIALSAFLVTALTAGQLSERAKRRAAEAEAGRSASAYNRSLIEANLDPVVTLGFDGRIIDVNAAMRTATGYAREELIGTDFARYFSEPDRVRAEHAQAWRTGVVRDRSLQLQHREGHSTSVLYNAAVYRDASGRAIGLVSTARPIRTSAAQPAPALTDPNAVRSLSRASALIGLWSAAVGALGLVGWIFGIPVLKSVIPGLVVIKPNAAVCLLASGLALWWLRKPDERPIGRARKRAGQLLAALSASIALLSLGEHIAGWDLGIDQWLFRQTAADAIGSLRPGLMAPITAAELVLLGLALLGLDWTIRWRSRVYSPAQLAAAVAAITSIAGLLDVVLKSATSYTYVALQVAVTLCPLSFGVLCARTERGVPALIVSSSVGGALVRRLLPAAIIVPLIIGGAWWAAVSAGLSSEWSGGTLMIAAMIALLGTLTVFVSYRVDRSDVLRRDAELTLHQREEELREAQRLARVGSWWWDPKSDTITWSQELYRIVGCDPKLPVSGYREQARFFTSDSRARLDAAVQQTLRTGEPYGLDLELVTSGGESRAVTSHGEVERDSTGRVVLVRGTVHDITERKQAEQALQRSADEIRDLYNHAPCGYHSLDAQAVFVRINDTELQWLGYAREEVIGKLKFSELVAPGSLGTFQEEFSRLKTEGVVRDVELELMRKDGTILPVLVSASVSTDADGKYLMSRSMVYDITERRRAEEQLRRVNRAHRALSSCNEALVRASDESALLQQICRIIVDEAGYRLCWVGYAEDDSDKSVRPVAQAGFDAGYLQSLNITWSDSERGRGPTGTCIRTGEIQTAKNIATDPRLAPWRADAMQRGYASSIAIALVDAGKPFGALTIYSSEVGAFVDEEVRLLTELAGDLGYGIVWLRTQAERKRVEAEEAAREREVAIGFKIQQMLLLDEPPRDIPGLRVAALTIPSQRIAGDFYEFFAHQNGSLDVVVADVMGKGIPAALLGAATKSHFTEALRRLIALSPAGALPEPREIVTLAHAGMGRHLIELESFVTLCYARVDPTRLRLDLVDCGHTGVVHVRRGTEFCEIVHGDNLPLGIREGEIYDQISVAFEVSDVFLFYSDGITEAANDARERFGTERLMACVRLNAQLAPEPLVQAIRAAVLAFAGSDRLTDDLTCVAIEVTERPQALAREELDVHSDLAELSRVRAFVRTFCGTLYGSPLDDDGVAELELAVNEAISNVVKHAYHGRGDQRIRVEAEAFPDRITIRLHHLGDAFDPSAVPPPAFDGSREGGFGVYLITNSVDEVRYYRDERGGNCIALVKLCNR